MWVPFKLKRPQKRSLAEGRSSTSLRGPTQLMGQAKINDAWKRTSLPEDVVQIPSMLSREELQYLSWLTSEAYEGWGAIVDLGPWLGSSTAALAGGLRRTGRSAVVRAFDLFRWVRSYMEDSAPEDLPEGKDFEFLFRRHTAPFSSWINAEKQDLT